MGNTRNTEYIPQIAVLIGKVWKSNDTPFSDKPVYPLVNIQKAMENGPVEIVDFPMKNGGSFHCYVSSPEGKNLTSDH